MASYHGYVLILLIVFMYNKVIYGNCDLFKPNNNPILYPKVCREVQLKGATEDGIYTICPVSWTQPINVYCDLTTENGGWTVFQRRKDGSVDFYCTWDEYRQGFGTPSGELWLGNDLIHVMTANGAHELRVDLENWDGLKVQAYYGNFQVASETDKFRLTIGNFLGGSAGDGLSEVNNQFFTTKDADNDIHATSNCATDYTSGFWYNACFKVNPNGIYRPSSVTDGYAQGIVWLPWKDYRYSLKVTEMKFRPVV